DTGAFHFSYLAMLRADSVWGKLSSRRYMAEKIKCARFVEIPGRDHPIWTGDVDRVIDEIEEFLTGARPFPDSNRVLATLLVARVVTSGRLAPRFSDRQWNERMSMLRETANEAVLRHGGQS